MESERGTAPPEEETRVLSIVSFSTMSSSTPSFKVRLTTGPMFAGKTEAMKKRKQKKVTQQNVHCMSFTHRSDMRPGNQIVQEVENIPVISVLSHGDRHKGDVSEDKAILCYGIDKLSLVFDLIHKELSQIVDKHKLCLFVDEIHFFSNPVEFLEDLKKCQALHFPSLPVVIHFYGLQYDYRGDQFQSTKEILSSRFIVEHVQIFGRCEHCGQPSQRTGKKIENKQILEVGGHDLYIPLCLSCFHSFKVQEEPTL